jgi:hypothetical protein
MTVASRAADAKWDRASHDSFCFVFCNTSGRAGPQWAFWLWLERFVEHSRMGPDINALYEK